MKLVVIGGNGLIGSKLVTNLRDQGHETVAVSCSSVANTAPGEGLAETLQGADVVLDLSNPPSFENVAVLEFFEISTRDLLGAQAAAGVGHHVALSVVGADRLPESGYLRAKTAQEKLIAGSKVPYSIVRVAQLFESVGRLSGAGTDDDTARLPPMPFQPLAADDVATAIGRIAVGEPLNGVVEVTEPEQCRFDDLIRRDLTSRDDPLTTAGDPGARSGAAALGERSVVPGDTGDGHAPLFDHFSHARGRARGPLVAVSPRTVLTNAAAADLVDATDRPELWAWATEITRTGPAAGILHLAGRGAVRARCEPVLDGDTVVGYLIRLSDRAGLEGRQVRVGRETRRRRARFGWDSLTANERGVAQLVAEGLTNRETAARLYLSPHTVDYHLRQIYRKLEIRSRVELARVVMAQAG